MVITRSSAPDQPRLLAAPDERTHPREREGQLWTVAHLQAAEFDRAVGRPRGRRRVVLGPRARGLLRNVRDGLEEPRRWQVALRGPSDGHQRAVRGQSVAIIGNQWHSVAISGRYLRQGEVLEEPFAISGNQ